MKDTISVKDGKVGLTLAEPVNAGGLQMPVVDLNGIVGNVNSLVANEINKLIAGVGTAIPTHRPTLQQIVLGQGVLEATFTVTIGAPTGVTTPTATTAPATTAAPVTTAAPTTSAPTTAAPTTAENTTAPATTQ